MMEQFYLWASFLITLGILYYIFTNFLSGIAYQEIDKIQKTNNSYLEQIEAEKKLIEKSKESLQIAETRCEKWKKDYLQSKKPFEPKVFPLPEINLQKVALGQILFLLEKRIQKTVLPPSHKDLNKILL